MRPFEFVSGTEIGDAASALRAHGGAETSRFVAGGTNLVDLMKLQVETPEKLIDITRLDPGGIADRGNFIEVGAGVRNSHMARHPLIAEHFPAVAQALLSGASPQLRNLATTAGNLLQRTRCSYFRDTDTACNKREPGTGCSATTGYNRMHAILGTSSSCIAANPSDLAVALRALDARVVASSNEGEREFPLAELYLLPGETPQLEHTLDPGELITSIRIPKTAAARNSRYLKIRDRASFAFALVSAAVACEVDSQGRVLEARIALGGVGTVPWRAEAAEAALRGQTLDEASLAAAGEAAVDGARPYEHNAFKVELVKRVILRAFLELGRESGPGEGSELREAA